MDQIELHLLADQAAQQHGEIGQGVAEIEHLRPQRLAARERQQLPHQRRRAGRVLLDLHDVLERRIGRLVRVQQEVVRHHDGGEHVVEIVRDAAGELADHVHLLRLVDLVLQRAPLGGLQHIDDGGLGLALVLLDRGDEELPPALLGAVEHRLDRRDIALPLGGLVDRRDQQIAVARVDGGEDRLAGRAVGAEALRQLGEAGIGADHRAGAVHGRNRHRGVIEEAHEADFGGALRIGTLVAGAADHQRARRAGHAVGAERQLVIEPHRHGLAAAHPQIDVEHFGFDFAGHRHDRGQKRRAVAGHDVGQLQPAGADLREVVIQPVRQRGVDIDEVAGRIDREEAARRMIEIFDGVLQFLEHVLLPFAVAGDVGDRPHRVFRLALALAERPDPHPQPAAMGAVGDRRCGLPPAAACPRAPP